MMQRYELRPSELMTQRYELRPDVVATMLEDGAVLLDLETKYFYRLNRTGWAITQLFESGASLHDVLARCQALGAPASDEASIVSVVEVLSRDNLVCASESTENGAPAAAASAIAWIKPTIEKQAEPLQRVIVSAFDPSVPLVE